MRSCRKLRARAAGSVFSLTAAALFTFLGLCAATVRASVISAQFGNSADFQVPLELQVGVEPDAAAADPAFENSNVWNALVAGDNQSGPISFPDLLDNTGTNTGASLSFSHIDGGFNTLERGGFAAELPDSYLFSDSSTQFTFNGLLPNEPFTLIVYTVDPVFPRQEAVFTAGNSTFDTTDGMPMSLDLSCCVSGILTGTSDATGAIHGTWSIGANNQVEPPQIAWAGFQLDAAIPEPSPAYLVGIALGLVLLGFTCKTKILARRNKLYS